MGEPPELTRRAVQQPTEFWIRQAMPLEARDSRHPLSRVQACRKDEFRELDASLLPGGPLFRVVRDDNIRARTADAGQRLIDGAALV